MPREPDMTDEEGDAAGLAALIDEAVPVELDPDAPPRQPYPPLAEEAPRDWLGWLFPRHRKS